MSVAYSPDSAYAKEMVKWESQHTQYGPPLRPYEFREFPKRLYKAIRPLAGGTVTFDGRDAGDENEERNLLSRGYRCGQDTALAALDKADFAVAEATANRHYHDARMGEQARREAEAADNATAAHVPVIPEKARKPRTKKLEVPNGL